MPLILPAKTQCGLCNGVLGDAGDVIAFPAFLGRRHALHRYSDAVFHKSCFETLPERTELELLYRRYREIWASKPENLKSLADINAWCRDAFKEFQ